VIIMPYERLRIDWATSLMKSFCEQKGSRTIERSIAESSGVRNERWACSFYFGAQFQAFGAAHTSLTQGFLTLH
jgi:hypothetical protein